MLGGKRGIDPTAGLSADTLVGSIMVTVLVIAMCSITLWLILPVWGLIASIEALTGADGNVCH